MQLHITHTTTALAVKALFIKLQNISTCRHRILHNIKKAIHKYMAKEEDDDKRKYREENPGIH